ncbi:MAG: RagB/SusD family nutrient uptake outer membrane protein [Daejeonella sp.]|uniref:RagB/SusD family nutrient uptake outer membrane protein n=1 Tax=Daejeonella sp. JGW-45 TaxID=3034148 RepID=UPI0023EDACED|nr:RagB/SusD family nutrient uptake outer membrane protein [Daejeonella sp. JGW-45]
MKTNFIYKYLLPVLVLFVSSCDLDQTNPNSATDEQVLKTREGIIALSIGIRQNYSTNGLSSAMLAPTVTAREMKGIATFTNTLELEAGGTALPSANGIILTYWSSMQRQMQMSENLIANAPNVAGIEPGLLSGIMAQAYLFKAMALANLATTFEQANLNSSTTEPVAFVPRAQVFAEALRLIGLGITGITTTAPSASFASLVAGPDFDIRNTLYAMQARINLMAGNYPQALASANQVDLTKKSSFTYTTISPNPLYTIYNVTKSYRPRENYGLPAGLYEAADKRLAFYFTTPRDVINTDPVVTLAGFAAAQTTPIPVYLTDEIKLIKAEATLRTDGPLTTALDLINEVRTQNTGDLFGVNAGLPAYSGAVTKDALLLEVYKQRCAELYLSGLKWDDTRRFNRPVPPANNSERNRVFYPYPDQERINNTNTPADPAI